jgi:hypothetical protein
MAGEEHPSNFIEQVEACRPGSDDLRAAELALAAERIASHGEARHYYERVQQADNRLAMAFHDLPVPEGLAARLLAALDAASPATAVAPVASETSIELPAAAKSRRLALRLALAASLLAVIGGAWALVGILTPYTDQQCLSAATQASAQLELDRWQNIKTTPAPADRQPHTRLFGSVKSWQSLALLNDQRAVAYRFTNGAMLLVCQPSKTVAALPIAPPAVPQQKAQQSSGTQVGMWTSGGLVHVLLVSGPIEEYRRMTGATRPVVALVGPQCLPDRYDG